MTQVEELNPSNARRVIDLIREYMIMTEIERGNETVRETGLAPVLVYECDHVLEVYGHPNAFFMISDSGRDLGGVGLKMLEDGKSAEVCRLYIRDEARGYVLGSQLMEKCQTFAIETHIDRLVLDILPSRTRIISWYEKLGFKPIRTAAGEGAMHVVLAR